MSQLAKVTRGRINRPLLVLVYGPDGVGKSSFGAEAPNPIFLGPESGTDNLDIARLPQPKHWAEIRQGVRDLINGEHDFKTLVIDSIDWCEPLLFAKICKDDNAKSIEKACGGWGKAYEEALIEWIAFREDLSQLRNVKQMNIVLIGHCDVTKFDDPVTQLKYDRYHLKLHKKASAMFREWVDAVLFCNFETYGKKNDERTSVFSDGVRVIHTERRPSHDAKNRYGLPLTMPLSWHSLVEGVKAGNPESVEAVTQRIEGLLTACKNEETRKKAQEYMEANRADVRKLSALANRLAVVTEEPG